MHRRYPQNGRHEEAHQRTRTTWSGRPSPGWPPPIPTCGSTSSEQIVVRADAPRPGKVGLVSGGGSGHEPLHGGFVGLGMLDAACPGEVFTSPVPDQILAATKAVDGGAGVVHIVKNYTGDVHELPDGRRARRRRGHRGRERSSSTTTSRSRTPPGPRAAAAPARRCSSRRSPARSPRRAAPLAAVAAVGAPGQRAVRVVRVALTACTTPAAGKPGFDLPDDEIEVGVGIHGEPGRAPRAAAPAPRDRRAARGARSSPPSRSTPATRCIVLVNGLGGTPLIELYVVYDEVGAAARRRPGSQIARNLVGNYVTSLDMAGHVAHRVPGRRRAAAAVGRPGAHPGAALGRLTVDAALARAWIAGAAASIAAHAGELTDSTPPSATPTTASTCAAGSTRWSPRWPCSRPTTAGAVLTKTGTTLVSKVGGASGPLYGTAVPRARQGAAGGPDGRRRRLRRRAAGRPGRDRAAGKAAPGDKTMVDALTPAVDAYEPLRPPAGFAAAAAAAAEAARCRGRAATTPLQARKGRASLPRRTQRRSPGPGRHVHRADLRRARVRL